MKEVYQQTVEEIQLSQNGHAGELSEEEVQRKREKYGYNVLPEGKKKNIVQIFLEQFKDFLVIILIASAIVSGFLGEMQSALVIFIVITMNAILGTVQTVKAEQSLKGLEKLSAPEAKVLRDGVVLQIPSKEVVPGDIVILEAGDYVPADGRLMEGATLTVDESTLSGESVPVEKSIATLEKKVPLQDRSNMVFSGSFVTYGRGTYIVTAIGKDTEVGKIAQLLNNALEKKTPLQENLDQFGQKLSILILIFCGLLFAVNVLRGEDIGNAFLFAVALAVAAIPEALSSIVTIVLAFGTRKMAEEHAIIRKLQAVEGLGSVSVLCSDKTGTLTQNKMTVEEYYTNGKVVSTDQINMEDAYQRKLLSYSILCNDSTNEDGKEIGDPTETALINVGSKFGISITEERQSHQRIAENPFDSDRKMMSTLNKFGNQCTMITKGAVDVLLDRIQFIDTNDEVREITEEERAKILAQNNTFSENGLRVLAFAYKEVQENQVITVEDEENLTFLGLIAMVDPPREESKQAVEKCKRAGIRPIMITGDHKITAAAIAKRIGILSDVSEACDGAVLDTMTDEELESFVEGISVYARVSPEHKIRIVRAWQKKGHIVSMTGDGVNDAPALKQADVGVAMGITGTEVSKNAASMILTDDNFSTIVKAVENGRNVYRNIKHAIGFLLAGNLGAILTVFYASLAGLPVPFAPVHLLFINLLTDSLPAIALGLEPHNASVMDQKPRPVNEGILTKEFLGKIGIEGLVIGCMTTVAFYIGYGSGGAALGSTYAFGTLCMSRLVHGFNSKTDGPIGGFAMLFNNKYLGGAFVVGALLLISVLMIPGLHGIFDVVTLSGMQMLTIALLSVANFPIIQLLRWLKKHRK